MAWWWGADGPSFFELVITLFLFGPLALGGIVTILTLFFGGATAAGQALRPTGTPPSRDNGQLQDPSTHGGQWVMPSSPPAEFDHAEDDGGPDPLVDLLRLSFTTALELMQVDDQVTARQLEIWTQLTALAIPGRVVAEDVSDLPETDAAFVLAHNAISVTAINLREIDDDGGTPPTPPNGYVVPAALACLLLQDQASDEALDFMTWGPELEEFGMQHRSDGLLP